MNDIIINFLNDFSYLAVFLLLFIECIFPPIPSEIVLLTAGMLVNTLDLSFIMMLILATLGSYVGAIILYFIGYFLSQDKIININNKKPFRYLRIKEAHINRAYLTFEKQGYYFVFFGRMVPIVRSLISIPAGSSKMNFLKFSFFTILGSLIWNTILILGGFYASDKISLILHYLDTYKYIVISIIAVAVVIKLYFSKSSE